jgi:hypothetical protein
MEYGLNYRICCHNITVMGLNNLVINGIIFGHGLRG